MSTGLVFTIHVYCLLVVVASQFVMSLIWG